MFPYLVDFFKSIFLFQVRMNCNLVDFTWPQWSVYATYEVTTIIPAGLNLQLQLPIEFFYDRRFCQIIWQIFTQGKAKKKFLKNCPQWGWKPGPPDLQANALPTELSQHSVASLNLDDLYKVMLY